MGKAASAAIRSDIVEAAATVFGRHGYERATLDEIAAIVGIQKGSLYHHISSKEQLLLAIHMQLYEHLDRLVMAAIGQGSSSPIVQLDRIISAIIETVTQYREMVNVFLRDYRALKGEALQTLVEHRRGLFEHIHQVMSRALADEGRDDIDPEYAVRALVGMCYWVNEWFDGLDAASPRPLNRLHDPKRIAASFSAIFLDGLRSRTPSRSPQ